MYYLLARASYHYCIHQFTVVVENFYEYDSHVPSRVNIILNYHMKIMLSLWVRLTQDQTLAFSSILHEATSHALYVSRYWPHSQAPPQLFATYCTKQYVTKAGEEPGNKQQVL